MKELLKIEKFKNDMNNCINNSQLSIGIIKYILKDTLNEIDILYNNLIQQELQEQQQEQVTSNPFKGFENKSIVAFEEYPDENDLNQQQDEIEEEPQWQSDEDDNDEEGEGQEQ